VEVLDIIKQLCKENNLSLSQLENELDFGNGSIAKSKGNMSADRMYQIAKYFKVPMEYLITGKTITEADDEVSLLRQQQSILMEINKISQAMSDYYKSIAECQDKLTQLKQEYNKIENKKKGSSPAAAPLENEMPSPPWLVPENLELPFK